MGITNWSFATSLANLSLGTHTLRVYAQYAGGTATAFAGGGSGSLLQGSMTVVQLNR